MSILGHELRSPLTVVRGVATLLLESFDELPRERTLEMLGLIDKHVDAMSERIEDLLTVCHIDAGDVRLVVQEVQVDELLQRLLEWAQPRVADRSLEAARQEPGLEVEADWDRTLQVLRALVHNSLRFSPPGSPVEVRALPQDGMVRFEVLDRGPGVPPDQRERIFQRLGRASGGGAGLGLYLARGLAEAMGGEAGMELRPDGGSIFWFTLRRHG